MRRRVWLEVPGEPEPEPAPPRPAAHWLVRCALGVAVPADALLFLALALVALEPDDLAWILAAFWCVPFSLITVVLVLVAQARDVRPSARTWWVLGPAVAPAVVFVGALLSSGFR